MFGSSNSAKSKRIGCSTFGSSESDPDPRATPFWPPTGNVPSLGSSGIPMSEKTSCDFDNAKDGSKWVGMFVEEMKMAVDLDDAMGHAARILEDIEQRRHSHSRGIRRAGACFSEGASAELDKW